MEISIHKNNTALLIDKVKEVLLKQGFKLASIRPYELCWNDLLKYEAAHGIDSYSPQTGMVFLEEIYEITVFTSLSKQDKTRARSIKLLNDYIQHGMFFPKNITSCTDSLKYFQSELEEFKKYQAVKYEFSESTLANYNVYVGKFLLYLEEQHILSLEQISPGIILDYCNIYATYSTSTTHNSLCSLRVFLRYLKQIGVTGNDYWQVVPSVSYIRASRLPSTFTKDEAQKIFEAIDRSSPIGKRDYAIMTVAYRLGLRSIDIRNMKFSNICWQKNTIELIMHKTGKPIVLPLLEDVGLAVIDYIKYGRPDSDSAVIFLRHISPIKPISAPGMTSIVKRYVNKAGIKSSPGPGHGPHAMRSSLASMLLEENVPLPVISEILGHSDTRSTGIYLKIDINNLRKCSLEVPEFDWNRARGEVF
ncbi:MAG: site-specific integrase [Candidatus Humimicrobiaceae bacterium]